mgnify:CR=1 FL=1
MKIRKSRMEDVNDIMNIIAAAKQYMASHGNTTQWVNGYPGEEIIISDIKNGNSYLITHNDIIAGTFSFIIGKEPTYQVIKNGEWHYDRPYGTIHRLASAGIARGISRVCFEYCLGNYIRIDTHRDNISMQAAIEKFGFKKCGNVYMLNGTERIAYDYLRL